MSSGVTRTTTSAALAALAVALVGPGLALADEAAGHYNLAFSTSAKAS